MGVKTSYQMIFSAQTQITCDLLTSLELAQKNITRFAQHSIKSKTARNLAALVKA